jgi:hypothetical protein
MKTRMRISKAELNVLAVLLNVIIVLLGLTLYAFNITTGGLPKEIGSGMVASGLAALILVLYQIASSAVEQREQDVLEVANEIGLRGYYPHRPAFGLDAEEPSFYGARRIQILELTGHTIFGKIQKGEWGRRCHEATIQVLLQDPLHPPGPWTFLNHRDYEEGNSIGTDLDQVYSFITKFGMKEQFSGGGSWELRLTRAIPTICYFRIDDCIYWAPYLAQVFGDRSPHMRVDRGGKLFEVLERHFDRLWEAEADREVPELTDHMDDLTAQWRREIKQYEDQAGRPLPAPSESSVQD